MPFERPEYLSRISLMVTTCGLHSTPSTYSTGLLEVVAQPLLIDLHLKIRHEHRSHVASERVLRFMFPLLTDLIVLSAGSGRFVSPPTAAVTAAITTAVVAAVPTATIAMTVSVATAAAAATVVTVAAVAAATPVASSGIAIPCDSFKRNETYRSRSRVSEGCEGTGAPGYT